MLDPKLNGFDGADVVVEPNIDLGASEVGVAGAALLVDIPAPPNENNFDGSAGLSLTGEAGVELNVFVAPFPNTFDVVLAESDAGFAGVEPNAGVVVEPNAGVVVEPNAGVVAAEPNAGVVVVELLPNAEGAAVFPKADVVVPLAAGVVPNADVVFPNAVKGDFGASLVSVVVEADGVAPNAGAAVVLPNILNADFGASFVSVAPEAGGAPNAGVVVVLPNPPNTDLGASFASVAPDPDAFDGAPNGVGADVEAALFAKRFPPVNPVFPNADFEASVVVVC